MNNLLMLLVISLSLGPTSMAGSSKSDMTYDLRSDSLATDGLIQLHLDDIRQDPSNWVIGINDPGEYSGVIAAGSSYTTECQFYGTLEVSHKLGKNSFGADLPYNFASQPNIVERLEGTPITEITSASTMQSSSVLKYPCTVVVKLRDVTDHLPAATEPNAADQYGQNIFLEVDVIPESWERFVAPALAIVQDNEDVLSEAHYLPSAHEKSAYLPKLQRLATDSNPLVALDAMRVLSETESIDPDLMVKTLKQRPGFEQAVESAYLLDTHSPGFTGESVTAISKVIADAKTVPDIIGLTTSACFAPGLDITGDSRSTLIDELRQKRNSLSGSTKDFAYFDAWLPPKQ